jgi:hypothetical protein
MNPRPLSSYVKVFPPWSDRALRAGAGFAAAGAVFVAVLVPLVGAPQATDVGYEPEQPVAYSHKVHVGELGLDCRYCHSTVEDSAQASIPPTQTCMNCHKAVRANSPKIQAVLESYVSGTPIPWVRVHDLPDFVYFDHSAHVRRGVGCVSCHGRVDTMEVVRQEETLSMGWCLDCHRNPEKYLRPKDRVTDMAWKPSEDQETLGRRLREAYHIEPSTDCTTCHR